MYRVAIIKDDFVCRRNSPEVCEEILGADKKGREYPGRVEKKVVRVERLAARIM